jgi:hypothetical protein
MLLQVEHTAGTAVFRNNWWCFNVTGFSTGTTEVFVTGGTYTDGTTFRNNTGGTFNVIGFSALTEVAAITVKTFLIYSQLL